MFDLACQNPVFILLDGYPIFAAATLAETLRHAAKREVELHGKRLYRRGLAQSLSEVMHQLHSPAKDPRQGNPCRGANKTLSSLC